MDNYLQDFRYALRSTIKNPGFSMVAILVLGLGIGVNTAIFSVIDGVLLRPFPFREAQRIVTLWQNDKREGIPREEVSAANGKDWRDRSESFEGLAIVQPHSLDFTGKGRPEIFLTSLVSEGFFRVFGVPALHGRTFIPEEFTAGRNSVVVLSHGVWQRRFGADPAIVNQPISLDGQEAVVVGVMPAEFRPRSFGRERDIWAPRPFTERDLRGRAANYLRSYARLKDGVSLEQAQSEMDNIGGQLAQEYPRTNEGVGVTVVPLPEQLVGHLRPALLILSIAVGVVLLIACANVANLLLTRNAERTRGFAIRAALGAGRVRLMRQLLTESSILGLSGGVLGLVLAWVGVRLIAALGPADIPRLQEVAIDGRILLFTIGISVTTAIVFGLIPALQFSKPDLQSSVKEGGRTATVGLIGRRTRDLLVVGEVAMAIVLLVCAGLFLKSFSTLLDQDPGFAPEKALALQVFVYGPNYSPPQQVAFFEEAIERMEALPGVSRAGAVSALPFIEASIDIDTTFTIAGRPPPPQGADPITYVTIATSGYFSAMGIPLKSGRTFEDSDHGDSAPVMLINETMAQRYWPDANPIGDNVTVRFGRPTSREIVGVVGEVLHTGLDSDPRPEIFIHHRQLPFGSMTFVIRTQGDPAGVMEAAKSEVWAIDPQLTFYDTATMEQLLSESVAGRRFNLSLLAVFAVIALVLSAVGMYGVISFSTRQRTNEMGLRMALGAQGGDIRRMVVREGLARASLGVVIGLVAAFVVTRFLQGLLFGVTPTDPVVLVGISALLLSVAWIASYLPARGASRVDPISALRYG